MEKVLQLIKDCKEKDGYFHGYVDGAEELENVLENEMRPLLGMKDNDLYQRRVLVLESLRTRWSTRR